MGRLLTSGGGSSGAGSGSVAPVSTVVTVNEAVTQGQIAVLGPDNMAYYAVDPATNPFLTNMRPIAQAVAQAFPLLQASAAPSGSSLSVNARVDSCLLSNGNVAVLTVNGSNMVQFTVYNPSGQPIAGPTLVGSCAVAYSFPSITALTGGNFVVAYSNTGGTGANPVEIAIYSNVGALVLAATAIDPTMTYVYGIEVCALSTGNFAIAYHGGVVGGAGITQPKMAIYSATGAVVLAASVLATNTTNAMPPNIGGVCILTLTGGGFVVGYVNMTSSTVGTIAFQRFNNAGALQGVATNLATGATITGTGPNTPMLYGVPLTGGGFVIAYNVTQTNVSIFNSTGVLQGASFNIAASGSGSQTNMTGTSDGGVAILAQVSGALEILKYTAAGANTGTLTLSSTSTATTLQLEVLQDNTVLVGWNDALSTFGIAILNAAATQIVSQGFVAGVSGFGPGASVNRTNPAQVTNAVKSTAVTYMMLGTYQGSLCAILVSTTVARATPIGVFGASAIAGASVPVQYVGNATLATGFLQPYGVNAQGATPPGVKMNVLGNSVILQGIQAPDVQRSIN